MPEDFRILQELHSRGRFLTRVGLLLYCSRPRGGGLSVEEPLVRRRVARDAMLSVLASDEPVAMRLLQARPRLERGDGRKNLEAHITCSVLAALAGSRKEAESCLAQVRGSTTAE